MANLTAFQDSAYNALNSLFEELGIIPHQVDQVNSFGGGAFIEIKVNHLLIRIHPGGALIQGEGVHYDFDKKNYPLAEDNWDFQLMRKHLLLTIKKHLLDPNLKNSPLDFKYKFLIMGVLFLLSTHWGIQYYTVVFHDVMGDKNELSIKLSLASFLFLFFLGKWLFYDRFKKN